MGPGPDGRPIRKHVTAPTQAGVTRKVRDLEKLRRDGTPAPGNPRVSLTEYLVAWTDKKATLQTVRPRTIEGYHSDLARIRRTIGHIRLDKLSASNVEHLWATMIAEGVLASVQHCKRTLDAALSDAVDDGLIAKNPVSLAATPRYTPSDIHPYTIELLDLPSPDSDVDDEVHELNVGSVEHIVVAGVHDAGRDQGTPFVAVHKRVLQATPRNKAAALKCNVG